MKSHFRRMKGLSIVLTALLFGLLGLGPVQPVHAASTFIPAPDRRDMVHDPFRNLLYITSGSQVLRYNMETQQFLPPIELGGSLAGIDLSPDGNTLAVADNTYSMVEQGFFIVDLKTGANKKVKIPMLSWDTGGTFAVAFGNNGDLLISMTYPSEHLYKYSPAANTLTTLPDWIAGSPPLSSSADGTVIGFAETDLSGGAWGRYRVSDGNIAWKRQGTGLYNHEIATNRNGAQFTLPTYWGAFVYDSGLQQIGYLEWNMENPHTLGAVYHPTKDLLYLSIQATQEVHVYDTATLTQVGRIDFGSTFQIPGMAQTYESGRLKTSRDGSLLFAIVDGGVSYVRPSPIDINSLIADKERACTLGWINQKTVCGSLDAKLTEAKGAIQRGQFNTAKNNLNDFISQLDAQLGKAVNRQAHDELKATALYVIAHLP